MSMEGNEDWAERAELLIRLRQGLRKSRQLAEHLSVDPVSGDEALGLLSRLEMIRRELDGMQPIRPEQRTAVNDPFWSDQPANWR